MSSLAISQSNDGVSCTKEWTMHFKHMLPNEIITGILARPIDVTNWLLVY